MTSYIGRFAPTPSGPLHFGSIFTALASYLDAKAHAGKWLLRIDDLDTPRVKSGATKSILETLELLHLFWDDEVLYQSTRTEVYDSALAELRLFGGRDLSDPDHLQRSNSTAMSRNESRTNNAG